MKKMMKLNVLSAAIIAIAGSVNVAGAANDAGSSAVGTTGVMGAKSGATWSDKSRRDGYMNEKDRLEQVLAAGASRDDYRSILEQEGYKITSINVDDEDELEYEVVKGTDTYEVQFSFDDGKAAAESIGVSTNIYKADATERALADVNYEVGALAYDKVTGMKYRDSQYTARDMDEKEKLEQILVKGKPVTDYRMMLENAGWRITSVNEREADEVEYEIVKGKTSYEVQLDFDEVRKIVSEVDVSTNIWQSKETERALGEE